MCWAEPVTNWDQTEEICDCCQDGDHENCEAPLCMEEPCACRLSEHALDNRGPNQALIERWNAMLAETEERTRETARVRQ